MGWNALFKSADQTTRENESLLKASLVSFPPCDARGLEQGPGSMSKRFCSVFDVRIGDRTNAQQPKKARDKE
jgi:hypothetical protein